MRKEGKKKGGAFLLSKTPSSSVPSNIPSHVIYGCLPFYRFLVSCPASGLQFHKLKDILRHGEPDG